MDKILKILLEKGLKKKLEERKRKKAEEDPDGKQHHRLIVLAVGLGLGAVVGLCVVRSLNARRKAQMEKALEELDDENEPSPAIKLPEEILTEEAPEEAPQSEPEA